MLKGPPLKLSFKSGGVSSPRALAGADPVFHLGRKIEKAARLGPNRVDHLLWHAMTRDGKKPGFDTDAVHLSGNFGLAGGIGCGKGG